MKNKEKYYGKKILRADFDNDKLIITFDDGVKVAISDYDQQCCETRYMRTDDDVSFLNGKILTGIEEKEVHEGFILADDCYNPEIVFLEIQTNEGSITFANYNEHNGYYGGFSIEIKEYRNEN